ncbi:MAG: o-succinylbenzoate---CoA ligase [Actinomycetota bacterium]|nr:o-succinylbenzoate---CoA ligase [Actinomycetota bacterium]
MPDEAALVAVAARGERLARAAIAAWEAGEAILPLDPGAPGTTRDELLERLRPTHLLEDDGRHPLHGGTPVASGVAAVMVTSGTTGTPKGVELTHEGLVVMARGVSAGLDATRNDRWLACLPLHHVAALAIIGRAWVTGVPWTAHDAFDVDAVARSARHEGTTIVSLVPTTLRRLLDARAPMHEFRRVVLGGAPCPPALRARAEAAGATIVDAYGMTETWGGFALDGVPIAGAEVRLADDSEILVRGAMVMRAYRFARGETTDAIDTDGWLHTGDIGSIGENGVLAVIDRKKDLVISGGINVSPTRVEAVLHEHPLLADVCVVGEPDDEWGERVVAVCVPSSKTSAPTLEDLREFARDRLPAAHLPREIRFVDAIPRSSGGKPLRRFLRAPR